VIGLSGLIAGAGQANRTAPASLFSMIAALYHLSNRRAKADDLK
jgi:hypothetical protein